MSESEGKSYNATGGAGTSIDYATDEDLRAARAAKLRAEFEPEGFDTTDLGEAGGSSTRLYDETRDPGFNSRPSDARGAVNRLVAERPLQLAAGALVIGALLGRFG